MQMEIQSSTLNSVVEEQIDDSLIRATVKQPDFQEGKRTLKEETKASQRGHATRDHINNESVTYNIIIFINYEQLLTHTF